MQQPPNYQHARLPQKLTSMLGPVVQECTADAWPIHHRMPPTTNMARFCVSFAVYLLPGWHASDAATNCFLFSVLDVLGCQLGAKQCTGHQALVCHGRQQNPPAGRQEVPLWSCSRSAKQLLVHRNVSTTTMNQHSAAGAFPLRNGPLQACLLQQKAVGMLVVALVDCQLHQASLKVTESCTVLLARKKATMSALWRGLFAGQKTVVGDLLRDVHCMYALSV